MEGMGDELIARSEDFLDERDFDPEHTLEARGAKYKLDIPTRMTVGGSPAPKDKPKMIELGEHALEKLGIKTGGTMVYVLSLIHI